MPKKITKLSLKVGDGSLLADGVSVVFDGNTLNGFMANIEGESDRSVVLVTMAIVEDMLERRLQQRFSKGNADARRSLFDMRGPFSTLSAKIEALFCLGDIGKATRDDLHLYRKLRNKCAHTWSTFSLSPEMETEYLRPMAGYDLTGSIAGAVLRSEATEAGDLPEIACRARFVAMSYNLLFGLNFVPSEHREETDWKVRDEGTESNK